jgi:hypothetical protein
MRTLYIHSSQSLSALAESCFTLTPKVSLAGPSDLYLEIGSTQKVFGGEAQLLLHAERLIDAFVGTRRGLGRSLVLVDRPEWARAFLQTGDVLLPPGKTAAALRALPIERLAWVGDPLTLETQASDRTKLVAFMLKVGLRTIGDFLALPQPAVHRRFGKEGEVLYDWALGERTLCLTPYAPQESIQDKVDADDLYSLDALVFSLRQVLIRMEARLQGRCRAAKKLKLTFHLESHPAVDKILEFTEPLQEAQAILRVLREFLSRFTWESPLVRVTLEMSETVPHLAGQLSLLDDSENKFHDLAHYVARLRARLGEENAGFAALKPSHLPERSCALVWPPPPAPEKRDGFPRRPLFLFTPPRPFQPSPRWDLVLSENLLVEWWEPGGAREYFIARNADQCLWVYRDNLKGAWFTHGTFD